MGVCSKGVYFRELTVLVHSPTNTDQDWKGLLKAACLLVVVLALGLGVGWLLGSGGKSLCLSGDYAYTIHRLEFMAVNRPSQRA